MLKPRTDIRLEARFPGYAYQVDAVEAVKKLPYAAVFHEQGLGKTKIGVDVALEWLRSDEIDSVLVVTKRGLIENWKEEIRTHTFVVPRVLDQKKPSNFFALNSPVRVYLTHYEVIKAEERRLSLFLKTRRVAAILDESHKIKNPESELAKVFHRLREGFVRRVIMTGTPVANRPFDLWSQIFFLDGGKALGTDFAAFESSLDLANDLWSNESKRSHFEAALANVFARIQGFCIRETKQSAGIQLPEKRVENVVVEAERRQRELYDSFRYAVRAEIVRDGKLIEDNAEDILKRLLRLVQVASNPELVDHAYDAIPGKFPKLLSMLEEIKSRASKVIVWTSFVDNADWLSRSLAAFNPAVVHGNKSIDERNDAIRRFKSDKQCTVLIATPGAAKEGLTLTVANHAVFYDRSFSLDDYLQAQDRIHRISQEQTCYVWNLICKDTVDEWVDMLLSAKRLAAQLVQNDIAAAEYRQQANYDFGRLVREILGAEGGHA
ncbi:DEAD/DEAH box helicase [Bradyrhizobium zhanjiangense]|uniref:DEAD/DEAH box helicase n=1 Tax=Bradyrhizobium zhanjiangense TaxID=1325107 RepID=A0A4Q0Q756_9BRAD|nr:DEAD/DEAH box helicase [Bradyrhizobium zhanjiangense]RXG84831.1 DEAD/DEAH box helicase [Bradyrhizobium zhanjiangense]